MPSISRSWIAVLNSSGSFSIVAFTVSAISLDSNRLSGVLMSRSCSPSSLPFRLFGLYLGRGRRPPTHGHEIVLGRINSNPVQPRIKGAVATECGECSIGLDERFLRHIFDLGLIANEARQKPAQLALVLLDKQLESALVATLCPL